MIELEINEIPPTINNYYGHRVCGKHAIKFLSHKGRDFKARIKELATQSKQEKLEGDLFMIIELQFPTKRKADIDNYCKALLDALTGVFYEDDSQITELNITKSYEKNQPKTKITIEAI